MTPAVTEVESFEIILHKIRQIARICEPCRYILKGLTKNGKSEREGD